MTGSRASLVARIIELEAQAAEDDAEILRLWAIIRAAHKMTDLGDIKRPLEPPIIVEVDA